MYRATFGSKIPIHLLEESRYKKLPEKLRKYAPTKGNQQRKKREKEREKREKREKERKRKKKREKEREKMRKKSENEKAK